MTISLSPIQNLKSGSCPHGLPPGACPICSGAGGGGGAAKKADFSAKAGEMSWSDCAAMGQFLKSQQMAKKLNQQSIQNNSVSAANFQIGVANLAQRISNFVQNIQGTMPASISKPLSFIANNLLIPMLNILKDIPLNLQKTVLQLVKQIVDISDKLIAMLGELKNAIEKRISDKFKEFKKKFNSLFAIFEALETDDEDKKIEESKRLLELKKVFETLQKNLTKKKEYKDD